MGNCISHEDIDAKEDIKHIRINHLKHALHTYPGLAHRLEKVHFTNGSSKEMNCLFGTISVPYR